MFKFDKKTLTELAGLGAGSVASAYVKQKLLVKADGSSVLGEGQIAKIGTDVAPILVGLFLQGQGSFLKEAGKGMIAESVGSLIKSNIPTLGVTGYNTLMGEAAAEIVDSEDAPLMGYSSSSYDTTAADGGEMDF